ncbi:hypothetical protein ACF0H5_010554 [Mactra antiquata]
MSEKTSQCKMKPDIDRGWAWIVMIAVYLGTTVQCLNLFMGGIIHIALINKFNEGQIKTSIVGALSSGLLCLACPLGGVLNNNFSCRTAIVSGAIILTTGLALSAFMPSLNWMIFTAGLLVGLGNGLIFAGVNCVVALYFKKWRDTVLSAFFLTVSFGMFLSVPLGLFIINNLGLSSTFLFLACLQAQICIVGVICKPSVIENKIHLKKKENRASQISTSCFDLSLLKNIPYLGFLCSSTTWNFALCAIVVHMPYYVTVLGGTDGNIAYLMTTLSVSNIVGRLIGAVTVSRLHHKSIYIHLLVLGICGICSALFPFYSKLKGGLYVFAIQLGIFVGWPNSMMTALSLSFVGVEKLSEATSLVYVFSGIGVLIGPVLTGYMYSETGSYEYSFLMSGVVLILGCLCCTPSLCCKQRRNNERVMETIVEDCQVQLKETKKNTNTYKDDTISEVKKLLLKDVSTSN